jgi:membrane protease YdiL (CAAX protease family)
MGMPGQEQIQALVLFVGAVLLMVAVSDILIVGAMVLDNRTAASRLRPRINPVWSVAHVWLTGQLAILATLIVTILLMIPAFMASGSSFKGGGIPDTMMPALLWGLVLQNIFLVAAPAALITGIYRIPFTVIGLRKPTRQQLIFGLKMGFLMLLIGMISTVVMRYGISVLFGSSRLKSIDGAENGSSAEGLLSGIKSPGLFALLFLGGAVGAPVGEEVFFRGLLYNSLKVRWGLRAAAVVSALIFAAVHVAPLQVLAIIPFGLLLAWAYERTGSLWVPIVMHATNNGFGLLLGYLFGAT